MAISLPADDTRSRLIRELSGSRSRSSKASSINSDHRLVNDMGRLDVTLIVDARRLTAPKTPSLNNYHLSLLSCQTLHQGLHEIKISKLIPLLYDVRFQTFRNMDLQGKTPSRLEEASTRVLEASLAICRRRLPKTTHLVWTTSTFKSPALLHSISASFLIYPPNRAQPRRNNMESAYRRTRRTWIH